MLRLNMLGWSCSFALFFLRIVMNFIFFISPSSSHRLNSLYAIVPQMNHETKVKNRKRKNGRKMNWRQTREDEMQKKKKKEWKKIHQNMCLLSIQVSGIHFSLSCSLKSISHIRFCLKRIKLPTFVAALFLFKSFTIQNR